MNDIPYLESITLVRDERGRVLNVVARSEDGTEIRLPCQSFEAHANKDSNFQLDFSLNFHSRFLKDSLA